MVISTYGLPRMGPIFEDEVTIVWEVPNVFGEGVVDVGGGGGIGGVGW